MNNNRCPEHSKAIFALAAMTASVAILVTCAQESALDKAQALYQSGKYREVMLMAKHNLRGNGKADPELLLLAGRASMRYGSEIEARSFFDACVAADSSRAEDVVRCIAEEAEVAARAMDQARARKLISLALDYRPGMDFGERENLAGEILLERRRYEDAIPHLERFIAIRKNDRSSAEAFIALASAYEKVGLTRRSVELYREFQNRYPKSELAPDALWELESILFKEAESHLESGQRAEAESLLVDLARTATSPVVKERSAFLLGGLCEEGGDARAALAWYRMIVNSGSSAQLIAKAKERIEKLESSRSRR